MPGARISKRNPTGYPDFTLPIGLLMQLIPVKLVPDWGAIEAEDVDVIGSASMPTGIPTELLDYKVPAGRTLLIYDWSITLADGDGQVSGELENETDGVILSYGGGVRGFAQSFSKPKRVVGGKVVSIDAVQYTGATRAGVGHLGGTLI